MGRVDASFHPGVDILAAADLPFVDVRGVAEFRQLGGNIGLVHLLQSRTDEAIIWLEKARNATPAHPLIRAWLASAYALKGETERAAVELAEARRLSPDDRFSSIARLRASRYWGVPKIRALFKATHWAGLRKARVPEG
jgi:hypothetical protein